MRESMRDSDRWQKMKECTGDRADLGLCCVAQLYL
jgi:hypothetical protein